MMIFLEDRLLSEFTFGFELEAWANDENDKYDFERWAYSYFNVKGINPNQASMKDDSSIQADDGGYDSSYECEECNGGTNECQTCGGSGEISGECPDCEGTGYFERTCPTCQGDGKIECDKCKGSGENISGQLTLNGEVEPCDKCNGEKEITCPTCFGNGTVRESCERCDGSGEITTECEDCEGRGRTDCEYCDGTGTIYDDDGYDPRTFEWASPVIKLTPSNLSRVINFLNDAVKNKGINTNSSCGFHIHLGFPDRSDLYVDRLWILLCIANNPIKDKILKFNGFELYSGGYANLRALTDLEGVTNISRIVDKYTNDKFVVFRQHPQGTLEWRGPRGFLDDKNINDIKGFFLEVFIPLMNFIKNAISEEKIVINDTTIYKKDILAKLKSVYGRDKHIEINKKIGLGKENSKFHSEQDFSEIKEIVKEYPQFFKYKMKGIKASFEDNTLFISQGEITNSDINDTIKRKIQLSYNLRLSQCKIDVNKILGSSIIECIVKSKLINNTSSIVKSKINTPLSTGSYYENCEISIKEGLKNNYSDSRFITKCQEGFSRFSDVNIKSGIIKDSTIGSLHNSEQKNIISNTLITNTAIYLNEGDIWTNVSFFNCTFMLRDEYSNYNLKRCKFINNDYRYYQKNKMISGNLNPNDVVKQLINS